MPRIPGQFLFSFSLPSDNFNIHHPLEITVPFCLDFIGFSLCLTPSVPLLFSSLLFRISRTRPHTSAQISFHRDKSTNRLPSALRRDKNSKELTSLTEFEGGAGMSNRRKTRCEGDDNFIWCPVLRAKWITNGAVGIPMGEGRERRDIAIRRGMPREMREREKTITMNLDRWTDGKLGVRGGETCSCVLINR